MDLAFDSSSAIAAPRTLVPSIKEAQTCHFTVQLLRKSGKPFMGSLHEPDTVIVPRPRSVSSPGLSTHRTTICNELMVGAG